MGSNTSKTNQESTFETLKNDLEISSNPDPRSPTPEITRTPLQGKSGAKHNITKNADLRKTFENAHGDEKHVHNNPILSAVIKNHLQSYDPRSPTEDFERTPIVIGSNIDELKNKKNVMRTQTANHGSPCLQNDELDESYTEIEKKPELVPKNLCDGFLSVTFNDTIKEAEEPLGSSTASSDSIENNITKEVEVPTKLLETNFDYVEQFEVCEENIGVDWLTASYDNEINKEGCEIGQLVTHLSKFKILPHDPRSPTNGIERTPIVVAKIEEESTEDNVEEMSDDTLIKVLQKTNAELLQGITQVKDQEGVLIYEDETTLNETPKKPKSATSSGARTPLSCMKNKTDTVHIRSKSANTLYDPKSQNNVAKKVSHIPRLKSLSKPKLPTGSSISLRNLSKASAIMGDCENTPPHSHRDKWDKDTSFVL